MFKNQLIIKYTLISHTLTLQMMVQICFYVLLKLHGVAIELRKHVS